MKRGLVTKLGKRTMAMPKNFDNDVTSKNCDAIFIFPIYGRFRAIWKPDSKRMFCTFSLIVTFYLKNSENKSKKFLT